MVYNPRGSEDETESKKVARGLSELYGANALVLKDKRPPEISRRQASKIEAITDICEYRYIAELVVDSEQALFVSSTRNRGIVCLGFKLSGALPNNAKPHEVAYTSSSLRFQKVPKYSSKC